jgi:hypothetical protein
LVLALRLRCGSDPQQETTMQINPHAAQVAQNIQPKQPPSQVAREQIAANAKFAESPFGKLVSSIAKGEGGQPGE